MKKFNLSIQLEINELWVEDGFNPRSKEFTESLKKLISDNYFSYCYDNEFKVTVK